MSVAFLRRKGSGKEACEAIASKMNNIVKVVRVDKPMPNTVQTVIRWGVAVPLGGNKEVFNSGAAIQRVSNKTDFRKLLKDKVPHLIPKTWTKGDFAHIVDFPVIARPSHHQSGKDFYYCETHQEMISATKKCGDNFYISQYIPKAEEYRVCFMQGRVAWVARKYPDHEGQIAWNNAEGGHFENVKWKQWKSPVLQTAYEAFSLSGLDFGGVDVITGLDGKHYVLEINSCMGVTSEYRQTCMAKVFDYMVDNGSDTIPLNEEKISWGRYIHPALLEVAEENNLVAVEKNPLEDWI